MSLSIDYEVVDAIARVEMVECSTEPRGRFLAFEVTGRIVETDPVAYIYIPDTE